MLKNLFSAHVEPVFAEFSSCRHMYATSCALRTYLRAVWWSHLELGRGVPRSRFPTWAYAFIQEG